MKHTAKRLGAVCLLCVILSSCGAADRDTAAIKESTGEAIDTISSETATEKAGAIDDLPSDLSLNGEEVSFLYRDEIANEFYTAELNGDVVNDALYNSRVAVEDRLNAKINAILKPGHLLDVRQSYMLDIIKAVTSGDSVYDWVDLMIGNASVMLQNGIFQNIASNEYINLTKPYYLDGILENMSFDGNVYFLSGDASLGYLKCTYCYYVNLQTAENHAIDIYDIVESGKWTIDKCRELTELSGTDLNGDGKYDENDQLGFISHDHNHPKGYLTALGGDMYTRDENGIWRFSFGSDRDAAMCDKLYALFRETPGFYAYNGTNAVPKTLPGYNALSDKFKSGGILGISAEMDDAVSQYRDMEDPYGIIPYPKLDEAQEKYHSVSRNTHNSFSLTTTAKNPSAAGAVMEALSAANYSDALPAYFETALKTKYSESSETAQMFDLVKESTTLTFWYVFANAVGSPDRLFLESSVEAKSEGTMASTVAKSRSSMEKALEKYLETIEEVASGNIKGGKKTGY